MTTLMTCTIRRIGLFVTNSAFRSFRRFCRRVGSLLALSRVQGVVERVFQNGVQRGGRVGSWGLRGCVRLCGWLYGWLYGWLRLTGLRRRLIWISRLTHHWISRLTHHWIPRRINHWIPRLTSPLTPRPISRLTRLSTRGTPTRQRRRQGRDHRLNLPNDILASASALRVCRHRQHELDHWPSLCRRRRGG